MNEDHEEKSPNGVPESPKPLAFTIDFNDGKTIDLQKHKSRFEKYQKRHKRGQSLSKIEDSPPASTGKTHPLTGHLPRKSSFQSEGYFSSDEKTDKNKGSRSTPKRGDLILPLKNITTDRMTQSFPSAALPSITSPDIELKDVSSPELDSISPFSPREEPPVIELPTHSLHTIKNKIVQLQSSPNADNINNDNNVFIDSQEFDFDKSDTVSDAGTYTLDADNYSEEQKARMSIDSEFKIEQVSLWRKTEEYVKSLAQIKEVTPPSPSLSSLTDFKNVDISKSLKIVDLKEDENLLKSPVSPTVINKFVQAAAQQKPSKVLSPILSPTQNMSITQSKDEKQVGNGIEDELNKTFTKIMFPSAKAKNEGLGESADQGSVISVTSSGAFRPKSEKGRRHERKLSLTKSEVHVEAYVEGNSKFSVQPTRDCDFKKTLSYPKLTANIVNVQSIEVKKQNSSVVETSMISGSLIMGKPASLPCSTVLTNLPPSVGGKTSPTKIPSPLHTLSRPRSRNSLSSLNVEFSDGSIDTEIILKPTQNYINTLQQRLSLDSEPDSDYDAKYCIQLNNTAHLLKQKAMHIRHNSLDDRTMNNKLEHFQNKNLQGIDQTYSNVFNQYNHNKVIHKIQNSPNNSPIRRSSSFSTKNQLNTSTKNTNVIQKELNICNSPNLNRNTAIQRSSSTANIKPSYMPLRRSSITSDHKKIDRSQFGDTESSSEEDFEKNLQKRRDLSNITNTRCNRAFSLRRARVDVDPVPLKCPNTPEMRRKHPPQDLRVERAISVDRKPMKTNEVQSRYLLNITKRGTPPPTKPEPVKNVPKLSGSGVKSSSNTNKPQALARTDSGRFSMRITKPPVSGGQKASRKDTPGKKSGGGRSNSSLSSREVEFQNWKRRKSYDPMKAAAEGKRKEIEKRQSLNAMTQSYTEANQSQDSSPSHSSSVHRSQSFHGTAAIEQLLTSSEEEEDYTLSADEGFSPPTPSPCELSPARASLRHTLWESIRH